MKYPAVHRDESLQHNLHGTLISDPYGWLEDENSAQYADFVNRQADFTEAFLEEHCPYRHRLRGTLTRATDFEKVGCPSYRNGRIFFSRNTGLQNQSVSYVVDKQVRTVQDFPTDRSLLDAARVLIDPNTLAADGTASVVIEAISPDAEFCVYGISRSGSDWIEGRVRSVESGQDLEDILQWVKFSSFSWTHDNKGFFYSRYPDPTAAPAEDSAASLQADPEGQEKDREKNKDSSKKEEKQKLFSSTALEHHKVYYHRLGTSQSDDRLIFEYAAQPRWFCFASVTDDGRFCLVSVFGGAAPENLVYVSPLAEDGSLPAAMLRFRPVFGEELRYQYSYVTSCSREPAKLLFQTNDGAARKRVIAVVVDGPLTDVELPSFEIVPEHPTQTLDFVKESSRDRLLVVRLKDAYHTLSLVDFADASHVSEVQVLLPGICSVVGLASSFDHDLVPFSTVSVNDPGSVSLFHVDAWSSRHLIYQTRCGSFEPSQFNVRQLFYPSRDGETRIPMFVVEPADAAADETLPAHLYAYGGFNHSMSPGFSSAQLSFVRHFHARYVVACIRGGGEYGVTWHEAAKKHRRQVAFDDFQDAAAYLLTHRLTDQSRLCISGGSNGGLLVAACANQRPDLYRAVIVRVGVLDMLRFHRFTVGAAWRGEYGDPDVPEDFGYLVKYSPLHSIPAAGAAATVYPCTLVTTGDHDDRVVPAHSFKFIAALQHQLGDSTPNPLLVRIDRRAGHGMGKPTSKVIEEMADIFAFMAYACVLQWRD